MNSEKKSRILAQQRHTSIHCSPSPVNWNVWQSMACTVGSVLVTFALSHTASSLCSGRGQLWCICWQPWQGHLVWLGREAASDVLNQVWTKLDASTKLKYIYIYLYVSNHGQSCGRHVQSLCFSPEDSPILFATILMPIVPEQRTPISPVHTMFLASQWIGCLSSKKTIVLFPQSIQCICQASSPAASEQNCSILSFIGSKASGKFKGSLSWVKWLHPSDLILHYWF